MVLTEKEQLNNLEKQLKINNKEYKNIQKKMNILNRKKRKKEIENIVNKYFCGVAADKNNQQYYKVIGVDEDQFLRIFTFYINEEDYLIQKYLLRDKSTLGKEITKEQFLQAWNNFVENIRSLPVS